MARAKLGVAGLDAILHGGVVPGNAILVEGTPGAGKTTLGMQFIYSGITQHNEPGLIVTFEEFPSQMYRDAGMLGWDLQALANENKLKIISTSPAVFRQETAGPSGLITQMAREIGAERVMVDSISHFQRLTQDPAEQREIFNALVNMLKRGGFTAMFTKEVKSRSGDEVSFEEYASDTAFRLTYEIEASTQRARYVEVVKARGQDFIPGKHSFLIGRGGITVFPSVALSTDDDAAKAHIERIDSGIPGLDEMLHGGFIRAWSLLLVGPAGSGKTIFGLQSVCFAAAKGESCLFLSLRERPSMLRATDESLSMPLGTRGGGSVDLVYQAPLPLNPYALVYRLLQWIDRKHYTRVVVDSLDDLSAGLGDPGRALSLIRLVLDELRRRGVTSILIWGSRSEDEAGTVASTPQSGLVDAIISLRFVESQGVVRSGLAILKSRGTAHSTDIRPYQITSQGLSVVSRRVTVYDD